MEKLIIKPLVEKLIIKPLVSEATPCQINDVTRLLELTETTEAAASLC